MNIAAKVSAALVLWRMFRFLRNWREVWSAYRISEPLPTLHFRRGFELHHGPGDDPIMLLHTVFAKSEYKSLEYVASGLSRKPQSGFSRTASRDHIEGQPRFLLDIGANIGAVTLDRVWRDSSVRVDAYEPNPVTCATLQTNVRQNGLSSRVRVFQEAVAGQNGSAVLWQGESSVLSSTVGGSAARTGLGVPVTKISFDHAIARTGADHVVVKLDAEGAEVEMLESASDRTLAAIDELVLEYHDSIVPDARARCTAVLVKAGFTCRSTPFNSHQGILLARRVEALS